jgi:hypothetical protein
MGRPASGTPKRGMRRYCWLTQVVGWPLRVRMYLMHSGGRDDHDENRFWLTQTRPKTHRNSAHWGDADEICSPRVLLSVAHLRHWLCTAAIVSVPIKVPVSAGAMLSSELGNRYAATRVITLVGGTAAAWPLAVTRSRRREAARSDCSILRIDLERDPVASGWVSPLSRNHHER